MWPSGPELVQTVWEAGKGANQNLSTMLSYSNTDELKTVRFQGYSDSVAIHEICSELMIQEELEDDTEDALRHLMIGRTM